jgi:hypothetical protein
MPSDEMIGRFILNWFEAEDQIPDHRGNGYTCAFGLGDVTIDGTYDLLKLGRAIRQLIELNPTPQPDPALPR